MILINTKIPKGCWNCNFCYDNKGYYCSVNHNLLAYSITDIPSERPSNCPLMEVVTCKDCSIGKRECSYSGKYCTYTGRITEDDFYCADAERKKG